MTYTYEKLKNEPFSADEVRVAHESSGFKFFAIFLSDKTNNISMRV